MYAFSGRGLCLLLCAATACGSAAPRSLPLHSDGKALRTADGRTQILRGVNARVAGLFDVTFDDGRLPLEDIPDFTAADAQQLRLLGLNLLRLPLNWSGLEPQPGQYSTAYLDRAAQIVALCGAAGVLVLLDLHQDAWSKEIGEDGAPRWAISPAPDAVLGGPLTDLDARRLSSQVLRAFRGFFEDNRDGLQDRFIAAAKVLMTRFGKDPSVVGLELFNEPIGTDAALRQFHERAAAAVRTVTDKLIFFEPPALRNQVDAARLPDTPFATEGAVYAPHVYTLAFGDPRGELATLSYERLAPSVRAAREEADAWGAPLFIGEYGIGPGEKSALLWLGYELDAQDETLSSSALWLWKEQSQGSWGLFDYDGKTGAYTLRTAYAQAVSRPYVQLAGGDLKKVTWDAAARKLSYRVGRTVSNNVDDVFVPDWLAPAQIACDGAAIASSRDPATGVMRVTCGASGDHQVEVSGRR